MRILYISDRGAGGIANHVKCLVACLPTDVAHYTIGIDEPFAGKNGHDIREWFQIRRVVKRFRPDVIHFHAPCFLMALYVRLFSRAKVVCSWHMPTDHPCGMSDWIFFMLLGKRCYFLPVSSATWKGLQKWLPYARGEVFFNPVRLTDFTHSSQPSLLSKSNNFTVGMVGRAADVKDWPSFHKVEAIVREKVEVQRKDGAWRVRFLNAGEKGLCDGRAAIAQMDLFLMTSKHEQLPTVVLECFAIGTPICGFLPDGGTSDILSFSKGPVDAAFLRERSCEKLADLVIDLLQSPEKRKAIAEDGRQILEGHFDAEKNVKGQLMDVYESVFRV